MMGVCCILIKITYLLTADHTRIMSNAEPTEDYAITDYAKKRYKYIHTNRRQIHKKIHQLRHNIIRKLEKNCDDLLLQ